jgi:hypothetical protein
MAKPPFPKFTADQRESMKVLDAHMLRVARPFFWHIGARNDGVPRGASAFILRFERGYVAVTCNHVLEQYEDALKVDARMICQLGTCQVWPEKSVIDRNKKLDIATFEVSEHQLKYIGGDTIDCRSQWPHDIKEGDAIKLTGFLDEERTRGYRQNEYTMPAWGAFGIAESVTGTDILTIYVPDEMFEGFTAPKPPLGLNMSGCSGGPCFRVQTTGGILGWFPVGLIYFASKKGTPEEAGEFASFDQVRVRRLHFLKSDGTIEDQDGGWLPGR